MEYTFVTSFRKEDYDVYAKKMLESVAEKWKPDDFRLVVYLEGYKDTNGLVQSPQIEYREIENIDARSSFIKRNSDKNGRFAEAPYNYRFDAVRFCHKVYAYSDLAFQLIEDEYKGWLVWLDADTITKKMFKAEDAAKLLPSNADIVHLGRIDIDYSETGFVGWNMSMHNAASLIVDIRGAYDTNEIFGYREWTDSFVFTRLLKIYEAHGARVCNLSEGVRGLAVFEQCILDEYFTHNKGNLKYNTTSPDVTGPQRYKKLADLVRYYSEGRDTFTIVETGTWNGGRAIEMALAAFENVDKVHYRGFDLFEEATEETDKEELNIKQHNLEEAVNERLRQFSDKMTEKGKEFSWMLNKGNTKDTLKKSRLDDVDFAYIDGGHSYETVANDYNYLSNVPVVVFDDFYTRDGKPVEEEDHQGIISVFTNIEGKKKAIIPSEDRTAFDSTVHLAVVVDKKEKDIPSNLLRVPIVVKPKDSMPSDDIQNNIKENIKKIKDFDWVKNYKATDEHAIIVSGGNVNFIEVKRLIKKHNAKVFCVKHSYPRLLKNGIKPFGCVILDPRPLEGESTHGFIRKDLFKTIDPSTLFFIASMTDLSVTDYILERTDNVLGFHAFTDAVRDMSVTDSVKINEKLGIKKGEVLISGGTCSATRTLGLLDTIGYRNVHLFGFDCSVPEKVAKKGKEELDGMGNPKYIHVETGGIKFWTTGELLALAQDLEKLFEKKDIGLNIKFYGDNTLASQVFKQSYYNESLASFQEFLDGRS
jgi:hypothetical protein